MIILLDTDIGTDIDDALALAYLLMKPECELMGITTVTGEAKTRAKLASVICKAANRGDIPIYPGNEECILIAENDQGKSGRNCISGNFAYGQYCQAISFGFGDTIIAERFIPHVRQIQ